jgi:hypothetical protein
MKTNAMAFCFFAPLSESVPFTGQFEVFLKKVATSKQRNGVQ